MGDRWERGQRAGEEMRAWRAAVDEWHRRRNPAPWWWPAPVRLWHWLSDWRRRA